VIADINVVCQYAMDRHGATKIHVVGHCFGAIPASIFACKYPDKVETLVLTTPGVYTYSDLSWWQKLSIFLWEVTGRVCYVPVPLDVNEFTDLEPYRAFIRDDSLSIKAATSKFYFELHQARILLKHEADELTMPILMVLAEKDKISDNDGNTDFFRRLPSRRKKLLTYSDAIHILEFSREREAFFANLAEWVQHTGRSAERALSP
jgi:alpha-beta hydrolase superfamily lysophospholipase